MYISARERKMLEMLLNSDNETTVGEIAEILNVSDRTIRRDLKGTETLFRQFGLSLKKIAGIGIIVSGDESQKRKLRSLLLNLEHKEYTEEERQLILMSQLLQSSEPIKQSVLASELDVTIARVGQDLDKIEEILSYFNLLLIRRRGFGVLIKGTEVAKRRVMSSFIQKYTDEKQLLSLIRSQINDRTNHYLKEINGRLLGLVDKEKLITVQSVITQCMNDDDFHIADRAYIGLVIHLTLAMERVMKGELVFFDNQFTKELTNTKEFAIASKILAELETATQLHFPYEETSYIAMHLMGAKAMYEQESFLIEDTDLNYKVLKLIELISNEIGTDLTKEESFYNGLITHLKPAVYRLEKKMGIQNPLLSSIKKEYSDLFSVVKSNTEQIFSRFHIPDEEIGYLVMHFASALLMKKTPPILNALVVCTSGIGTSKILAARILQEFPEVKKVKNISAFNITDNHLLEYDLILSTVPLDLREKRYFLIDPFLADKDSKEIKAFVKKLILSKMILKKKTEEENSDFLENVKKMSRYSDTVSSILENFMIIDVEEAKNKEQLIQYVSASLENKGLINNAEQLSIDLIQREQKGGLGIPGTGIALLHTRSVAATSPSFTIFRVKKPIRILGMDNVQMQLTSALVMVSQSEPEQEVLETLSHISSLVVQDKSTEILEYSGDGVVFNFLSRELQQFLGEIITKVKGEK